MEVVNASTVAETRERIENIPMLLVNSERHGNPYLLQAY
jgi:hypothetical protein